MRVPSVDPSHGWCVPACGPRSPRWASVSRRPAATRLRDGRVPCRRVQVSQHDPGERRVQPPEERLGAAPPRGGRGAVPVRVGDAEDRPRPPVAEPAERDDAGDRVAPGARAGPPGRVGEPADRPAHQAQPRRAIRDRAAFAAPAAVVTAGAGAGVAGQPARQPPLLEEADLLQADDVGVEAGDRRRAGAGPQRPAVAPVPPQAGAHVERSDAQRGRRTESAGLVARRPRRRRSRGEVAPPEGGVSLAAQPHVPRRVALAVRLDLERRLFRGGRLARHQAAPLDVVLEDDEVVAEPALDLRGAGTVLRSPPGGRSPSSGRSPPARSRRARTAPRPRRRDRRRGGGRVRCAPTRRSGPRWSAREQGLPPPRSAAGWSPW